MTQIITKHLQCDGCSKTFGPRYRLKWRNFKELRKEAKLNGWSTNGVHDWCDACTKVRRDEPQEIMTYEELKAWVAKNDPDSLHTFDWESHPEGWESSCYCSDCLDAMQN